MIKKDTFFVSVWAQGDPLISALTKKRQEDLYAFRAAWLQSEFQGNMGLVEIPYFTKAKKKSKTIEVKA